MQDGPHAVRSARKHVHAARMAREGEVSRVHVDQETDDVRLHAVRVQRDPVQVGESLRQDASPLHILGEFVSMVVERVQCGRRKDARLAQNCCLKRRARATMSRGPASAEPTGAPSPLE